MNLDVTMKSDQYGEENFYNREFPTNKSRTSFIKEVQRLCRTSDTYKRWLKFIRGSMLDKYVCYKTGVNNEICEIECHHHPLSLWDYVELATEKLSTEKRGVSVFMVAEEVMKWHYMNKVGFIPLSSTEHQKYHNKALIIPIELVEGNWEDFFNNYINPSEVKDQMISKIELLETVHLGDCGFEWFIKEKNYEVEIRID